MGRLGSRVVVVYQALWVFADDGGVARIEPDVLKGDAFLRWPEYTHAVILDSLVTLHGAGRVRPYAVGDSLYGEMAKLTKHSPINRPSKFRHPRDGQEVADIRAWLSGQHSLTPSVTVSRTGSLPLVPVTDTRDHTPVPVAVAAVSAARERLPDEFRDAYDNWRRAAATPTAYDASVADCGPGGMSATPGATWLHVGQALREMASAGPGGFTATRLRGFIRRLVTEGTGRTKTAASSTANPFGTAA